MSVFAAEPAFNVLLVNVGFDLSPRWNPKWWPTCVATTTSPYCLKQLTSARWVEVSGDLVADYVVSVIETSGAAFRQLIG